jgi:hypothetical protein
LTAKVNIKYSVQAVLLLTSDAKHLSSFVHTMQSGPTTRKVPTKVEQSNNEAHITLGVKAKVEPKSTIPIGAISEISP